MAKGGGAFSKKWVRGLIIGAGAALVGAILLIFPVLDGLERSTWDIRARAFAGPSAATEDVVVIFVDQNDLDLVDENYGISWPWPRSVHALLVDFARQSGAASVIYDIVFEDQGWAGPDDDMMLQFSAEQYGRFIYAAELFVSRKDLREAEAAGVSEEPEQWPAYVPLPGWTVTGLDEPPEDMVFLQASFPEILVTARNGILAFANQLNDEDGVFRRYRLAAYHLEQPVPSLAAAAVMAETPGLDRLAFGDDSVVFNETTIPIDENKAVLLRYTVQWERPTGVDRDQELTDVYGRNTFFAWEIIQSALAVQSGVEPVIPLDVLEGKHVLVGLSASGLYDLRPTPLSGRAPGVTVHAQMLDNLLSGEFMRDFPMWATILILVLLTIAAAISATYTQKAGFMVLVILGFLLLPFVLAAGGYVIGFWFQFVVPVVAVFLALAVANVANYATEGAQRRFIRGAFAQYMSPARIEQLEQDPDLLQLGGQKRQLTMLFSDVEGFTSISEALEPEQLTKLINDYLTPMTNIIVEEEEGTIDKYEGDAIIAFWNAPTDQKDHAARGVRAALKCQQRLREMNVELSKIAGKDMKMRIGLNTGDAVVGNMGSETRFDYTMLGDSVNLAARLESANKQFGTYTMISRNTLDELDSASEARPLGFAGVVGDIAVRELGRLQVKGKLEPVTVFEVMSHEEFDERRSSLDHFCEALRLYYNARFQDALEAFSALPPDDPAAAKYAEACALLIKTPPKSWDGRMTLEAK
jgi:adenylate cyclase